MGLGDTMRGEKLPEAYSPASRGSARAAVFERMPPNEGGLMAVGGRSGQLFREMQPGKKGNMTPLVRGHQKGDRGWVWASSHKQ